MTQQKPQMLHLYLYIYVSLEFLLPTLNKFTIQNNAMQYGKTYRLNH